LNRCAAKPAAIAIAKKMNIQNIIVGIIILAALFYVGKMVFGKVKSFSGNEACGGDCGCETKSKAKTAKI
jgi:hypothetical protein